MVMSHVKFIEQTAPLVMSCTVCVCRQVLQEGQVVELPVLQLITSAHVISGPLRLGSLLHSVLEHGVFEYPYFQKVARLK